ncbi:conserved hypothetical protein [Alteromonas sp. 38]|uniref:HAD family hydrolase n=1 Tax=unclassified Alteromonas TaxID=2614992 RepID=UPI0012F00722|nr:MULTISPECIES: hypothetical protein [unclassified Alteromonas]CAD5273085.1 conserved hypothetical protein [Alteromonas sp. 154]VXB55047.1 conserved hypothetical protein [Alteromonas sp. 38]
MKLLIFDLDLTLVNTTNCQDYLKTAAGREQIVTLLNTREVATSLYFPDTAEYINSLVARFESGETDALPIIVSDSPKPYCEAVLAQHGININSEYIFGSSHKPCVKIEEIYATIDSYCLDELGPEKSLVIGDSARDIHFAHIIGSPSIWTAWSYIESDYMFSPKSAIPTYDVSNLNQLKNLVESYLSDWEKACEYQKIDFKKHWKIESVNIDNFTQHQVEDIGFVKHYVPEALNTNNQEYISTFFEVHWMMKPAKDVRKSDLWNNTPQQFFTKNGQFTKANRLMSAAGSYKHQFMEWLDQKGITGKVLLVPVPSSVPAECNRTHTMNLIAQWWTNWLNETTPKPNYELVHQELVVERFQPKEPSHRTNGERSIEVQLSTMGVFTEAKSELVDDISSVIFLDDVATSGQSINAMATIFRELGVVHHDIPLFGYVWFKTHHPTPDINLDELIALADRVAAEN